jgi:hypothetical protein
MAAPEPTAEEAMVEVYAKKFYLYETTASSTDPDAPLRIRIQVHSSASTSNTPYCHMLSYVVICCHMLSYVVIYCHTLTYIVTYCHVLS